MGAGHASFSEIEVGSGSLSEGLLQSYYDYFDGAPQTFFKETALETLAEQEDVTTIEWGDDTGGYHYSVAVGTSESETLTSGTHAAMFLGSGTGDGGLPESASEGSLLSDIEYDELSWNMFRSGFAGAFEQLSAGHSSDRLNLIDTSQTGTSTLYAVPNSVGPFGGGSAPLGSFLNASSFGFEPGTSSATVAGLPNQKAAALTDLAQAQGAPDGVSRSAPPAPASVLVALAAAGRNPADLTLTTAGTEAVDPPDESHEKPGGGERAQAMGAQPIKKPPQDRPPSAAAGNGGERIQTMGAGSIEERPGEPSRPLSLDDLQTALDIAGFVDPTGAADLANAGISASRGDYTGAGISLAAIFGFDILKGLKRFRKLKGAAEEGANLAKGTAKQADKVAPLVKKGDEAADVTAIAPNAGKAGVLEGANFAQPKVNKARTFSPEGKAKYSALAGSPIETVDDLAAAIRAGKIDPSQLPVDYVIIDGQKVILNTRTSAALEGAGVTRSQWYGVDQSGVPVPGAPGVTFDDLAKGQIQRNGLPPTGTPIPPK